MNLYPKITIVTPSYNQGQYIEQTIQSVLGQNYPNCEYIIIDGGSTDNSLEIIEKYADRITYWVSEKDNGQAEAINKGFKKATGEILGWLNSDDMYLPGTLDYIAKQFYKTKSAIYFGNSIHFSENFHGVLTRGSDVLDAYNNLDLALIDYIIQPSSFWTRNVWDKIGLLNEELHFGFDWEWFLRAKQWRIPFIPISRPLSLYRIHDQHKSGKGGYTRQKELLKIYKVYNPRYAELFLLLIDERFKINTGISRHVKAIFRMLKLDISNGRMLKLFKRRKYSSFKSEEINAALLML